MRYQAQYMIWWIEIKIPVFKGLFTWKEGAPANRAYPPRRVET